MMRRVMHPRRLTLRDPLREELRKAPTMTRLKRVVDVFANVVVNVEQVSMVLGVLVQPFVRAVRKVGLGR